MLFAGLEVTWNRVKSILINKLFAAKFYLHFEQLRLGTQTQCYEFKVDLIGSYYIAMAYF